MENKGPKENCLPCKFQKVKIHKKQKPIEKFINITKSNNNEKYINKSFVLTNQKQDIINAKKDNSFLCYYKQRPIYMINNTKTNSSKLSKTPPPIFMNRYIKILKQQKIETYKVEFKGNLKLNKIKNDKEMCKNEKSDTIKSIMNNNKNFNTANISKFFNYKFEQIKAKFTSNKKNISYNNTIANINNNEETIGNINKRKKNLTPNNFSPNNKFYSYNNIPLDENICKHKKTSKSYDIVKLCRILQSLKHNKKNSVIEMSKPLHTVTNINNGGIIKLYKNSNSKINEKRIIMIQKYFRGYLARKKYLFLFKNAQVPIFLEKYKTHHEILYQNKTRSYYFSKKIIYNNLNLTKIKLLQKHIKKFLNKKLKNLNNQKQIIHYNKLPKVARLKKRNNNNILYRRKTLHVFKQENTNKNNDNKNNHIINDKRISNITLIRNNNNTFQNNISSINDSALGKIILIQKKMHEFLSDKNEIIKNKFILKKQILLNCYISKERKNDFNAKLLYLQNYIRNFLNEIKLKEIKKYQTYVGETFNKLICEDNNKQSVKKTLFPTNSNNLTNYISGEKDYIPPNVNKNNKVNEFNLSDKIIMGSMEKKFNKTETETFIIANNNINTFSFDFKGKIEISNTNNDEIIIKLRNLFSNKIINELSNILVLLLNKLHLFNFIKILNQRIIKNINDFTCMKFIQFNQCHKEDVIDDDIDMEESIKYKTEILTTNSFNQNCNFFINTIKRHIFINNNIQNEVNDLIRKNIPKYQEIYLEDNNIKIYIPFINKNQENNLINKQLFLNENNLVLYIMYCYKKENHCSDINSNIIRNRLKINKLKNHNLFSITKYMDNLYSDFINNKICNKCFCKGGDEFCGNKNCECHKLIIKNKKQNININDNFFNQMDENVNIMNIDELKRDLFKDNTTIYSNRSENNENHSLNKTMPVKEEFIFNFDEFNDINDLFADKHNDTQKTEKYKFIDYLNKKNGKNKIIIKKNTSFISKRNDYLDDRKNKAKTNINY